jgi:hypothetical protein
LNVSREPADEEMVTHTAVDRLAIAGVDAVALKPTEHDLRRARELPVGTVAVDYEGREHIPSAELLQHLAPEREVRLTIPVRADGFDPLGEAGRLEWLPSGVDSILVAGHGASLTDDELRRAIAPQLSAARKRFPEAWLGTEGVERISTALGGPQYELLSKSTHSDLKALRAAGFEDTIAVYAPTVLTADTDALLNALGAYVSRRRPVRASLPDADVAPDASATGETRETLLEAIPRYGLVGTPNAVGEQAKALREAGADVIVSYPARGLGAFLD